MQTSAKRNSGKWESISIAYARRVKNISFESTHVTNVLRVGLGDGLKLTGLIAIGIGACIDGEKHCFPVELRPRLRVGEGGKGDKFNMHDDGDIVSGDGIPPG